MILMFRYCISTVMDIFVPAYLQNTYLYQLQTHVSAISEGKVLFADTVFHPQGGGQPNDKGWVEVAGVKRVITGATSNRETGEVWNSVDNPEGINVGDQAIITIDQQTRQLHARLHSAGHLIDLAVQTLNYPWTTTKGYHFADSPYVEYKGATQNAEKTMMEMNEQLQKILHSEIKTVKEVYSYNQAVQKKLIPVEFKTPLVRIIKFGANSCPCGGTHIESVKDIKSLRVIKLQKKSKNLRAYYEVL